MIATPAANIAHRFHVCTGCVGLRPIRPESRIPDIEPQGWLPQDRRNQLLCLRLPPQQQWIVEMRKLCLALILALCGAFILPADQAQARKRHHHHHHVGKHAVKKAHFHRGTHRIGNSVSLSGVTPVLASKARQIASVCGSNIVSAVSRRGRRSNHPIGRAVDMQGNPGCIYGHLKGWPGGYSTDYSAVRHVHISYNPGGQEWGLRFAHNGHRKHSGTRYARRNLPRYVMHSRLSGAPRRSSYF